MLWDMRPKLPGAVITPGEQVNGLDSSRQDTTSKNLGLYDAEEIQTMKTPEFD